MAKFNNDTNYTTLIEKAIQAGNYGGAALLEQQRNEKIAAMNAAGDKTYSATNNYSQYLPNSGTTPGSAQSVYTHNASQDDIKNQMNVNSANWWGARGLGDTTQMTTLSQANQKLSALLGEGIGFDDASGKWSGAMMAAAGAINAIH